MTSTRQRTPRTRTRPTGALIALGWIVGCLLVTAVIKVWQDRTGESADAGSLLEIFAGALGYGVMGYLIATRAPGNRLGPLMLGVGVVAGLQGLVSSIDSQGSQVQLPELVGEWLYGVGFALQMLFVGGVIVTLLLAPTGEALSSRWRWLIRVTVLGVGCLAVDALLYPEQFDSGAALTGTDATVHGLLGGLGSATLVGLAAAPVCLGLRWYRAKGLERQQVMWVAAGGLAGPLLVVVTAQLPEGATRVINNVDGWLHGSLVWSLAALALPAGIAVAVLRHRLYDIDKVVSRTTSYAVVTGVVVAIYIGIVAVATSLFQLPNQISVAVATLTAAAAFRPLLIRARIIVDRRFNRSRYDADQTVQSFARRLRDEVDPEIVSGDLLAVLDRTMQPSVAGLWVRNRWVTRSAQHLRQREDEH